MNDGGSGGTGTVHPALPLPLNNSGKTVLALTQAWLRALENDIAEAAARAAVAATEAEQKAAADLRARLAASIAAFKAKTGLD